MIPHHRRRHRLLLTSATVVVLGGAVALHVGWPHGAEQAGAAPAAPADALVAVSHILVAHAGAADAPGDVVRSREAARDRARRIAILLRTDRGDLATMARRYSDDPTAAHNGGYLGTLDRDELEPQLAAVVCSLTVGEIGGPVETAHGFHVVRREPLRHLNIHHLLVAYRGAALAPDHVSRDRTEAARVARALHRKATGGGTDLCVLAARFSDDGENRARCGEIGWVEPRQLAPSVASVVDGLAPGEVSPVVESEYGFHIFWRD